MFLGSLRRLVFFLPRINLVSLIDPYKPPKISACDALEAIRWPVLDYTVTIWRQLGKESTSGPAASTPSCCPSSSTTESGAGRRRGMSPQTHETFRIWSRRTAERAPARRVHRPGPRCPRNCLDTSAPPTVSSRIEIRRHRAGSGLAAAGQRARDSEIGPALPAPIARFEQAPTAKALEELAGSLVSPDERRMALRMMDYSHHLDRQGRPRARRRVPLHAAHRHLQRRAALDTQRGMSPTPGPCPRGTAWIPAPPTVSSH